MADEKKTPKKRDESLGALFRRKRGFEGGTMEGKTVVGGPTQTTAEAERDDTPAPRAPRKSGRKVRSTPQSREAVRKKRQKRKFSL